MAKVAAVKAKALSVPAVPKSHNQAAHNGYPAYGATPQGLSQILVIFI